MSNSPRRINGESSHNKSNGKLAKAYLKFIETMWAKSLNGRQRFVFFIILFF